ncbi:hypothetical protein ASG49_04760 [Marmoricola sp. Leaf446]|uniref:DUF4389 domain-containing protein n=1 Tax=Marmoricola sp. Leaf446 TaxID=1736379 RepID=UPI0006FEC3A1|nr:DUF4389 domain-containing protein [Marmoricola sp. Leaf446]KQT94216.1 hypothetical protein ASG49_04760 [Marmoricola sp. Leaf446]
MTTTAYPVHVDADLDPGVGRWLWLFKWLLVLPHYVVLAFLWLAFTLLSVVAFVGILVTGRYPRGVFEFNVGVLRWSWRVAYYAYGALGTDRYPPFTLHDVADYPAHLEVDYPEHLSRGLVLVKWWLLAIPHYVVVGLLVSGTWWVATDDRGEPVAWGAGLIGLLVLVAGVTLLVTGRYPQPLFDLVLGLNRWVLRVAGYAGLMTDRYPPFSLVQGGHEGREATLVLPPTRGPSGPTGPTGPDAPVAGAPSDRPPRAHHPSGWTAGRVVSVTLGALVVTLSLGFAVPFGALVAAEVGARDADGFVTSEVQPLRSPTYAVASTNLALHVDAPPALTPEALLGDTRLTVTPSTDEPVFVGIAPTAAVADYLRGVERDVVTGMSGDRPLLERSGGDRPTTLPEEAGIWTARSTGTGPQRLTWTPQDGDWTVVVMNADASAGVDVGAAAGAEVPALRPVMWTLLGLASGALLLGGLLVLLPLRAVSRDTGARAARAP